MATRYSKRQYDGTLQHYDTLEEMHAANPKESTAKVAKEIIHNISSCFNPLFAFWGFLITLVICTFVGAQFNDVAKGIKILFALGASFVVAYLAGKFGNAVVLLAITLCILGVVGLALYGVWQFI